MMKKEREVLLSICIPTYNGGKTLEEALRCVLIAIKDYPDVEVVVSDNCSKDSTPELLKKFESLNQVRINHNASNLGFNGNMLLLLEKLARGKYCWVLGDDDFISSDSLELLHDILLSGQADYVAVGFQTRYMENYKRVIHKGRKLICQKKPFFGVMDSMASLDNILGTFMSVHIFNLEMVRSHIKEEERSSAFDTFSNIFPNSVLMTDTFHGSGCCYIVKNVIIEAIYRPSKSYEDKWTGMVDSVFPNYYRYCLSLGGDDHLLKNNKHIIQDIQLQKNITLLCRREYGKVEFKKIFSFKSFGSAYRYLMHQIDKRLR